MGGAGADIFYLEPEPKKISGAGAEENWLGSAALTTPIYFISPSIGGGLEAKPIPPL